MKQSIFLILLLLCISCAKEEGKIASIKIKSDTVKFIEIRNPIDDITLWNNKTDTIYQNSNKEFLFTKEIDKPEFVSIKIGDKHLKSILLPGKTTTIALHDSIYVFEGTNKAAMQFLNDVDRPYFSMNESNKYKNDSTAIQIEEKISILKATELDRLQDIINNAEIDSEFEEVLKKEIDYFYALRTSQVVMVKQYSKTPIADDLLALLDKTLQQYPLKTNYTPSTWNMYAETILREKGLYDELTAGNITTDTLQNYYKRDELHPFYYNIISSYKDKSVAEKTTATYIINEAKQNKFEKSLISVYEQFQKDFPNSPYEAYLTPDIDKIRAYYKKIAGEMPEDVKLLMNL